LGRGFSGQSALEREQRKETEEQGPEDFRLKTSPPYQPAGRADSKTWHMRKYSILIIIPPTWQLENGPE